MTENSNNEHNNTIKKHHRKSIFILLWLGIIAPSLISVILGLSESNNGFVTALLGFFA